MKMIKVQVLLAVALLSNAVAMQGMTTQANRWRQMRKIKVQKPIQQPTPMPQSAPKQQPTPIQKPTWGEWAKSLFSTKKIEPVKINEPIGGYATEESYTSPFGSGGQKRMYSTRPLHGWRSYAEPGKRSLKSFIPFTQDYYDYENNRKQLSEVMDYFDRLENALLTEHYTEDKKREIRKMQADTARFTLNFTTREQVIDFLGFNYAMTNSVLSLFYTKSDVDAKEFLRNDLLLPGINFLSNFLKRLPFDSWDMLIEKYPFVKDTDQQIRNFMQQPQNQKWQQEHEKQQERQEKEKQEKQNQQNQRQHESQFGVQSNLAAAKNKLVQLLPGITTAASEKEIGDAYRKFVRQYHPDVTKSPNNPMSLRLKNEINPAWDMYQDALKAVKQEKGNRE